MALVHGLDASGYLQPLLVDGSGNTLISGTVNANLNAGGNLIGKVDINTAPTLTVKGTNSDKLLSISDRIVINGGSVDLPAGSSTYNILSCPANTYYCITAANVVYYGTLATIALSIILYDGAAPYIIYGFYSWTVSQVRTVSLNIFMKAGDIFKFTVDNATLHDVAVCNIFGYALHST